jgi:hypothetical protein
MARSAYHCTTDISSLNEKKKKKKDKMEAKITTQA